MNFLKEAIAGEMLSQRDEAMELPLLLKEETERTPTDATTQTLLDEAARMFRHGCQMAIARFLDRMCLVLLGFWSMAPLRYAAKFDPFPSLDCALALQSGAIQGKEGIKLCHLATLPTGRSTWPIRTPARLLTAAAPSRRPRSGRRRIC